MQPYHFLCTQCKQREGPPLIVRELHFGHVRGQGLDNSTHLTAYESKLWQILEQSNYCEKFELRLTVITRGHKMSHTAEKLRDANDPTTANMCGPFSPLQLKIYYVPSSLFIDKSRSSHPI